MYPFNIGFDEINESDLQGMRSPFINNKNESESPAAEAQPAAMYKTNHRPSYNQPPLPTPAYKPDRPSYKPDPPPQQPPFPNGPSIDNQYGKPSGPPPSRIPEKRGVSLLKVDSGSISGCLFRYTYVWLNNGMDFWFFPVRISRNTISGFRWYRYNWAYIGLDLKLIDFFQCT